MLASTSSVSTWCGHRGEITGLTICRRALLLVVLLTLVLLSSGQYVNATPPPLDQEFYDVAELARDNQLPRRELNKAQARITQLYDQLDELQKERPRGQESAAGSKGAKARRTWSEFFFSFLGRGEEEEPIPRAEGGQ